MEMDSFEQNKVALYLFNSIKFKIKNCKSLDNTEQMFQKHIKQVKDVKLWKKINYQFRMN